MDLFGKIREEHKVLLGLVDDLVGADQLSTGAAWMT